MISDLTERAVSVRLTRQWLRAKQITWFTNKGLLTKVWAFFFLQLVVRLASQLQNLYRGSLPLFMKVKKWIFESPPREWHLAVYHVVASLFYHWLSGSDLSHTVHTTQWKRGPSLCAIRWFASLVSWHILWLLSIWEGGWKKSKPRKFL